MPRISIMPKSPITLKLPIEVINAVDDLVMNGIFLNRSEALRYLIVLGLKEFIKEYQLRLPPTILRKKDDIDTSFIVDY